MQDLKMFREYAADCIRIAQSMNDEDRAILLKMAHAWEDLVQDAERREQPERDR